ncbi:MAG: TIGR00282 family metallophosphoesterase [Candidatus Hydrogenedentota bacterium]
MHDDNIFRITVFGDIIGKPGRRALTYNIERISKEFNPDLIIANGENLAGGMGLNQETVLEILNIGVDVITGGNHSFNKKESLKLFDEQSRLLRPANYPPGVPGRGQLVLNIHNKKIAVINLLGRVFLDNVDCPFRKIDEILETENIKEVDYIIVDFHAEATSEKVAMGHYLDNRVSLLFGTHTHIPTADERILPGGTAYITDIGMVGPQDSVIGMETSIVFKRIILNLPERLEVAKGKSIIQGINVSLDKNSKKAVDIARFSYKASD